MKKSLLLLAVVLGHTGCAPPGTDTLPEAVRAVATRAASSTPDRLLVVDGTFGDTAMSFATRQALVTAGVVVEDRPADADSAIAVLAFVSATGGADGWRLRTVRSGGGTSSVIDALAAEERVEWRVICDAAQCEVTDSTAW